MPRATVRSTTPSGGRIPGPGVGHLAPHREVPQVAAHQGLDLVQLQVPHQEEGEAVGMAEALAVELEGRSGSISSSTSSEMGRARGCPWVSVTCSVSAKWAAGSAPRLARIARSCPRMACTGASSIARLGEVEPGELEEGLEVPG
jgi:hypothetical protein